MNPSTFLVIGGAGYIGSHTVKALLEAKHQVVIVDDLSAGKASAILGGELVVHNFADSAFLTQLFQQYTFSGVFHFASQILVGESVSHPAKYYRENTAYTLTLLDVLKDQKIPLVFSSTAAVYGEPRYTPIDEQHSTSPVNPYGKSKLMVEQMLQDFHEAYGLNYIALRYFNAAGADAAARIGEQHQPETHLIPLVLQAILGKLNTLSIYGNDYATPDGTCIRDYIHVDDLASAHLLAMQYAMQQGKSGIFNLGHGTGYSIKQVIETAQTVTGKPVPHTYAPRRAGDPAVLVADASLAKRVLGWTPQKSDLATIIADAWRWEQKRP